MQTKLYIIAFMGALAVGIGAFGAHVLKPLLTESQLDTFKTASLYHFIHLLAMTVIAFRQDNSDNKVINQSFYLFAIGIVCFSGSLYILSIKALIGGDIWNFVGPITPLGGLLFILAWLNLVRVKIQ